MKWLMAITMGLWVFFCGPEIAYANDFKAEVVMKTRSSVVCLRGAVGHGSGVVVGKRLIVTAAHVVDNLERVPEATLIKIVDNQQNEYKGETCFVDEDNDLALVRVFEEDLAVPPVSLDLKYEITDPVFAVGYCLQRIEQHLPEPDKTDKPVSRIGFGTISDVLNTAVFVDIGTWGYGMSGGGLFDVDGRLIGIVSMGSVDGMGKLGVARKVLDLNFRMTPVLSEAERQEPGVVEKIAALSEHVRKAGRFYQSFGHRIYTTVLMEMTGEPQDTHPEEFKRLYKKYQRPHRMYAKMDWSRGYLYIYWVTIWYYPMGYEKWTQTYRLFPYEGMWFSEALEGYIVADNRGLIMTDHGRGRNPLKSIDTKSVEPEALWWIDYAYRECIEQFIPD